MDSAIESCSTSTSPTTINGTKSLKCLQAPMMGGASKSSTVSSIHTNSLISSLHTKNKRKNFNPRFTAAPPPPSSPSLINNNHNACIEYNFNSAKKRTVAEAAAAAAAVATTAAAAVVNLKCSNNLESNAMVGGGGGVGSGSTGTDSDPNLDLKFREFAFKTMQELLNIYGLSVSQNDILDAFKQQNLGQQLYQPFGSHTDHQQHQQQHARLATDLLNQRLLYENLDYNNDNKGEMEPPTPPRSPIIASSALPKISDGDMCTSDKYKMSSQISNYSGLSDYHDHEESMNNLSGPNSTSSFFVANENSNSSASSSSSSSSDNTINPINHHNNNNNNNTKTSDIDRDDDDDGDRDNGDGAGTLSDAEELLNDDVSYDSSGRLKLSVSPINVLSPILQLTSLNECDRQITVATAYTKLLKKCESYLECNNEQCKQDNLREHYHCHDDNCSNRILNKKDEILRHLKWHRKRNASLNHGFLRFSSSDDCTMQFKTFCQHNRKQTHYHCIQPRCDKVYISTSDVQMHSNYHRKDSAIIQEGFQRFRATEECKTSYCMFVGQRTTHFHCRRANCNYTFKNKSDMEKHKTYHIKDEQLARDGFKKFLKSEPCPFESCRFSRVCNHIHCTRTNCQYVLHSSGQLLSHKRKHERIDSEAAYRQFKLGQKSNGISFPAELDYTKSGSNTPTDLSAKPSSSTTSGAIPFACTPSTTSFGMADESYTKKVTSTSCRTNYVADNFDLDVYRNLIKSPTTTKCDDFEHILDDYFTDNCTKQAHHKNDDDDDDQCEPLNLKSTIATARNESHTKINCFLSTQETHLHCLVNECEAVLPKTFTDIAEHLKMHELTIHDDGNITRNTNLMQITSIEGFFNRKRGRPPKNRVVEVYSNTQESPQAIFTSFKLEKVEQNEKPNRTCTTTTTTTATSVMPAKEKREVFYDHAEYNSADEEPCGTRTLSMSQNIDRSATEKEFSISTHLSPTRSVAATCKIEPSSDEKLKSQVVRAVGTYFPQNSDTALETENSNSSGSPEKIATSNGYVHCKRPFCKLKKKPHHHCDLCNQAFSDKIKLDLHSVKHQATKLAQLTAFPDNIGRDILTTSPSSFTASLVQQQNQSTSAVTSNLIPESIATTLTKPSSVVQQQIDNLRINSVNFVDHITFTHSLRRLDGKPYSYVQLNPFYNQDQYPMIGVTLNEKRIHEEINKQTNAGCKLQIASFISEIIQENVLRSFTAGKFDVPKYDYVEHQIAKTNTPKRKLANASDSNGHKSKNPRRSNASNQRDDDNSPWTTALTMGNPMMAASCNSIAGNSQNKMFKDEPIPNGYTKFRFNEDCNFTNCGYRNHQSHFHCCRIDCFYSFCDKTRFVQHTARHERLDKLMGDDFKQYRANMRCSFPECAYNKNLGANNKSSHFHCLKCEFICSDTNKVVAHRRQHSKMEYIRMAGFRKIANNEQCNAIEHDLAGGECSYSSKQTHYHCLVCDGSVLSRAQLGSHRHRV